MRRHVWPIAVILAVSITCGARAAENARQGKVVLNDHALRDDGGEFVGLGASYFTALYRFKFDRQRFRSDLEFLSRSGVNYIRTLSMVGWYPAWKGREIAPVAFTSKSGETIPAWDDYRRQLADMIDIAYDDFGVRTQITIFADAQLIPPKRDRIAHLELILGVVKGREHKVILIEVGNEAWQNGFPGEQGVADLREFGKYLADRTHVLVALSATPEMTNESLARMYVGSAADIATEHFSRDIRTIEGGWLPVHEPFRVNAIKRLPPVSHNEPIGPGSSVAEEREPIRLVCAAASAWMSGFPMFVYHTSAGIFGDTRFQDMPAAENLRNVVKILPGDIANWKRSEGKDADAPFITYANGQPGKWWPEVEKPMTGVVRHLSCVKGDEFYTLPIGILSAGVVLEARGAMRFDVLNPLTGETVRRATLNAGERITLEQGPQAYILRGRFTD